MRNLIRCLLAGILFGVVIFSGGCLMGGNLSGGSIPIGGDIDGSLALQLQPTTPLEGITVDLLNPAGKVKQTATADALGHFLLKQVPSGKWRLRTQQGSYIANVPIELAENDSVNVALILAPQLTPVQDLRLLPSGPDISLFEGDTVTFTAEGTGDSGTVPVTPCWIVHGPVGAITPDGVFTAAHAGTGTVTAAYGDLSATVRLTVSHSAVP